MHNLKKYIELLEDEIHEVVKAEADNGKLSIEREKLLHILFENKKHAKECLKEKENRGAVV